MGPCECSQYSLMRSIRVRTHIIDAINVLLDSSAALAIKATFAAQLQAGDFAKSSMRLTLAPAWAAWALTVLLACAKHRNERMLGSRRDLAFIFLLFVAFKVSARAGGQAG
ncbi:RING-type domain-containing protein, partial [Haematococcus lacustris]